MTALTRSGRSGRNNTMNEDHSRIAFWLLPAAEESPPLQRLIDRFASRYGAVRFIPHITLQTVPAEELPDPDAFLERFCRRHPALTLEISAAPQWNRRYTRALSLPVAITDALATLVKDISSRPDVPKDYRPHISLLYGDLDRQTGTELADEVALETNQIGCDRVAAVRVGPKTESAEDVRNWQVLATKPLCS